MMNGALSGNLNFTAGQRIAMHFLTFGKPVRNLAAFGFNMDPHQTNGMTYYMDVGGWNMPLKILRSSANAKPVLMLLHGMGLHPASFRGIARHLLPVCDLILVDYTSFTSSESSGSWPDGGMSLRVLTHAIMRIAGALGLKKINIGG